MSLTAQLCPLALVSGNLGSDQHPSQQGSISLEEEIEAMFLQLDSEQQTYTWTSSEADTDEDHPADHLCTPTDNFSTATETYRPELQSLARATIALRNSISTACSIIAKLYQSNRLAYSETYLAYHTFVPITRFAVSASDLSQSDLCDDKVVGYWKRESCMQKKSIHMLLAAKHNVKVEKPYMSTLENVVTNLESWKTQLLETYKAHNGVPFWDVITSEEYSLGELSDLEP